MNWVKVTGQAGWQPRDSLGRLGLPAGIAVYYRNVTQRVWVIPDVVHQK